LSTAPDDRDEDGELLDQTPKGQIYLILTAPLPELAVVLAAVDAAPVAAVQLRLGEGAGPAEWQAAIAALKQPLHERGIAVMLGAVEGQELALAQLVRSEGLDGLHVESHEADIATLRRRLGDGASLGASAGTSRDRAMTAADAGADYISFGPVARSKTRPDEHPLGDLWTFEWWDQMTEIPSVAAGGLTAELAGKATLAGADFVAFSSFVWTHPDGPAAAVTAIALAVDAARAEREAE